MIQRSKNRNFFFEKIKSRGITRILNCLNCDNRAQLEILRSINYPHSTFANDSLDLIPALETHKLHLVQCNLQVYRVIPTYGSNSQSHATHSCGAVRLVETGWRAGDDVEVTKGLTLGERIVISGTFFIDSEST